MELVGGPQEGSSTVLLTLAERKSRQEMIFKLPDKRACTIRKVFDALDRIMLDFYQRFKAITTDNGPEFLEHDKLVKSVLDERRSAVYRHGSQGAAASCLCYIHAAALAACRLWKSMISVSCWAEVLPAELAAML